VRISVKSKFSKSSESIWSDEIYHVTGVKGSTITLNDQLVKKANNLLKVNVAESSVNSIESNPINEVNKEARINRRVKKSGVDRNDDKSELVESVKSRVRNKKVVYDV
jgi:hypothetical protein